MIYTCEKYFWEGSVHYLNFAGRRNRADCMPLRARALARLAFGGLLFIALAQQASAISAPPLGAAPVQELLAPFREGDLIETAFREGLSAYESGDYKLATRTWQMPADRGHSGAQFSLGVAYATGRGVEASLDRAIRWWQAAATQGHMGAQLNLGMLYWRGEGVEKDVTKARMWWQQAATSGDAAAQFHLGALAAMGDGEPLDYKEAMRWWRLAAAQGYRQAIKGIEILKNHGAALEAQ
jgi:TPR repeat protein